MQQAQKQSGEDLTLSQQGGQGDEVLMLSVCLIAMFFVLCYVSLLVCGNHPSLNKQTIVLHRVRRSSILSHTLIPFTHWFVLWANNNSMKISISTNTMTEFKCPISTLKIFAKTKQTRIGSEIYLWYLTGNVVHLSLNFLMTTLEGGYWSTGQSQQRLL